MTNIPTNILTIGNLDVHYFVPQGTPAAAQLCDRLDRVVQQRLPQVAGGALQVTPSDEAAVYRIRQLEVQLWFDSVVMNENDLVERVTALTMRSMTHSLLYGAPTDVVRFDDHAHYVASFLGDLLSGQAWSRWVYEEFSPLRDLPSGQIAAQLLGARPGLLLPVARRLAQSRQLEPLLQRMQLADIRVLLRNGLGFAPPVTALAVTETLTTLLLLASTHAELERKGDPEAQARNVLRVYLAVSMVQPKFADHDGLMAVAYHLALIVSLWSARPSAGLWQALAQQEITTADALEKTLASLSGDLQSAATWLRGALANAASRRYLAALIPVALPEVVTQAPATHSARTDPAPSERIKSAFAGLALLMPALRNAPFLDAIGRQGIYQLMLAAVGRPLRPLAWGDDAIAWLAGLTADEMAMARTAVVNWPPLDEATSDNRDVAPPAEELGFALAEQVMRDFAQGLRGFAHSSPDFLAQNFLRLSGVLVRSDETLEVHLDRAPFGIVLQMAGRVGEQGVIPWLDERTLHIFLPAG